MTDGAASGNSSRSNQYGGNVPRRLSYASVASGATSNQPHLTPTRSGAFAHLVGASPSTSSIPIYHTVEQYNRRPSVHDHDPAARTSWREPAPLPAYSRKFANIASLGTGTWLPTPSLFRLIFVILATLLNWRLPIKPRSGEKESSHRPILQPLTRYLPVLVALMFIAWPLPTEA